MKFLALSVILALAVALSSAASVDQAFASQWQNFKSLHGKSYDATEEKLRMQIFSANMDRISRHNARYMKGEVSYSMGMNQFGDLTTEEFSKLHKATEFIDASAPVFTAPADYQPHASIDWRDSGYVSGVKDQGSCGSCWSFSTTGVLEGMLAKKTGQMVPMSEQNLMDCSTQNSGCNGGVVQYALNYVKSNRGIDTESSYPYEGRQGSCRYSSAYSAGVSVSGYMSIRRGDESNLLSAVSSNGPVSVCINASSSGFQFYASGVFNDPYCSSQINHAVLAVGYGSENGDDYWLVKNSWGTGWGDNGYIKMSRNRSNQCGIANQACYPY